MSSAARSSSPSRSSIPPPHAGAQVIGKRPRASKFMRLLVTVTAVTHLPFVVAVAELLRRGGLPALAAWGVGLALAVFGIWAFFGRAQHIMHDTPRPWSRVLLFDLPYYWHWCTCLYCLVPSLVYVVVEPMVDAIRGTPIGPNPGFFMWLYATGLVVCGYGVSLRRWFFETHHVEVPIRGLDKDLDGYTIAQLSDLHIGAFTPKWWAERWVHAANAGKPDMIAVTGDMVTSGVAFHEDIAELIGGLRAKDGTFVVMGNHDYFGEGEPLVSLLREKGAHVLRNEGRVIDREGTGFFLAGVDDTWTQRANLEEALAQRPESMPTILLQHDPDRFPHAVQRDVALVLSGHTHGGQVAVPFLARHLNASKLAHHFHLGLYTKDDSTLYVHPGLGTTGPPFRLGAAPAIVFLKLRAA